MTAAKIMIIDDSPTVLAGLSNALKVAGFDVITQAGWMGAYYKADAESPDLILVDVNMPGLKGTSMVETLKGYAPLVYLHSSLERIELIKLVRSSGAHGYITKDGGPAKAAVRVAELLRGLGANDD